ncbi:unannotated protein [freshwater metagenome]
MTVESIPQWFEAGASFVGLGGPLLKGGIQAIPSNVASFIAAISAAREVKS